MKTVILGAGFTGLAAGIKTGATIYEATDKAGGICRDYVKDGFRFSNGGPHYIFGKDKGLEYIKTLVEVKEYERKAGVYYNHTFPYPFQSAINRGRLGGDAQKVYTLTCYDTFMYWLEQTFGIQACNMFFFPFNEKYTAGLMGKGILRQDEYKSPVNGTGWVNTFCDPVDGLSSLVDKMASKCTINYNTCARWIDTKRKTIGIDTSNCRESDAEAHYENLISTIPLNKLMEMCGQKVNLPYTSVLVINIGAERGHCTPDEHWLYIPFCKSGFHRVSFYSNVDPDKAPEGKVGLAVEIAFKDIKYEDLDIEKITFDVINELQNWNWIGKVITVSPTWVDCAYTWLYNKQDREDALAWLKERNIYSIGRYGSWNFQGLTKSIEDGFNAGS